MQLLDLGRTTQKYGLLWYLLFLAWILDHVLKYCTEIYLTYKYCPVKNAQESHTLFEAL